MHSAHAIGRFELEACKSASIGYAEDILVKAPTRSGSLVSLSSPNSHRFDTPERRCLVELDAPVWVISVS